MFRTAFRFTLSFILAAALPSYGLLTNFSYIAAVAPVHAESDDYRGQDSLLGVDGKTNYEFDSGFSDMGGGGFDSGFSDLGGGGFDSGFADIGGGGFSDLGGGCGAGGCGGFDGGQQAGHRE